MLVGAARGMARARARPRGLGLAQDLASDKGVRPGVRLWRRAIGGKANGCEGDGGEIEKRENDREGAEGKMERETWSGGERKRTREGEGWVEREGRGVTE